MKIHAWAHMRPPLYNKKDPQRNNRLGMVSKNILLDGLTSFMVPASPLFLMWIKTNKCLVRIKDPYLIDVSSPSINTNRKIWTQKCIVYFLRPLNTGFNVIKTQIN